MGSVIVLHPLTEVVYAAIGVKARLPVPKRNKGKLDNWLSMYHRDATNTEDTELISRLVIMWKAAIWVGKCAACAMETWAPAPQDVKRLLNEPCANCGDVVIPF